MVSLLSSKNFYPAVHIPFQREYVEKRFPLIPCDVFCYSRPTIPLSITKPLLWLPAEPRGRQNWRQLRYLTNTLPQFSPYGKGLTGKASLDVARERFESIRGRYW